PASESAQVFSGEFFYCGRKSFLGEGKLSGGGKPFEKGFPSPRPPPFLNFLFVEEVGYVEENLWPHGGEEEEEE
ncbi:MAG: hypothetical protein R3Y11_09085, partial [Pseudomonadota bacterium]